MAKILPKDPLTPVNPVIQPDPPPPSDTTFPKGNITTKNPINNTAYGIPWTQVSRWFEFFKSAAAEFGISPLDLAAMSVIESNSQHYTTGKTTGTKAQVLIRGNDGSGVPSVGMMQVKPLYHQSRVPDADAYTPQGNLRMAAAILGQEAQRLGSVDQAILKAYFPKDDPNGTTQAEYLETKRNLVKEIQAASTPTPPPQPQPTDPYRVLFGGDYPKVTYGFLSDEGYPYYEFGVGHGTTKATQHTGDDVPVPFGTTLYAPASGVVECVGERGTPHWGQACGAYTDTGDAGPDGKIIGVGNITIYLDSGHKLTLGHCRTCDWSVGSRIEKGAKIGSSGGQNGAHTHVEISVERDGTYWLIDPFKGLQAAMSGGVIDTRPMVLFAGATRSVPLSVPYRQVLLPPSQKNQRPGIRMTPKKFIQHETDNTNPGMGAAAHLRFLQNGARDDNGNPQQLGFHFAVDDVEVIQMIPLNEATWHGGDGGQGLCNLQTVACELCVEDNNVNKVQARKNAEEVAAAVMTAMGIHEIEQHSWCCANAGLGAGSGCHTNCPRFIRADNYWPTFLVNTQKWLNSGGTGTTPTYANPALPPEFTGDDVTVNNVRFLALQRNFVAKQDGVPALQYADLKSNPVRAPLMKGEKFTALYLIVVNKEQWLVSQFGSRIPANLCEPAVTVVGS